MKVSHGQERSGYLRTLAAIYTTLGAVITTLAALMFLAALADHFWTLRWGLDYDHAWILLIVIATCLFLLAIGRAIFRALGAFR
jgi:hypothetical protein